jgi:5-methylthioribose kinase
MSLDRAYFENAYYSAVAPHVGRLVPQIYHYDPVLYCTVMERLSPHIILRQGLIEGRRYPRLARDLGEYVAQACYYTSDLAGPFETKLDGIARFAGNKALVRITVDLVFTDPYRVSARNRHTSPQLDAVVADLRRDGPLKVAAAHFGWKFLNQPEALLHGDLHSGSVMVTPGETRVIDPEFAFYGPIGFDLGAFFANLLLSWYSQPGHAMQAAGAPPDDRVAHQEWILDQIHVFWETFRSRFLALWADNARGDAYPAAKFGAPGDDVPLTAARRGYLDTLFADMVGFAACKMIRRIVGFAHVIDFERIQNADLRSTCEAGALAMADLLLKHPHQFRSVDDVIDAVPRMRWKAA